MSSIKRRFAVVVLMTVMVLCAVFIFAIRPGFAAGAPNTADWTYTQSGNVITLTDYTGSDVDVVIPNSGDFGDGVTLVKITKDALRAAGLHEDALPGIDYLGSLSISTNGGKVAVEGTDLSNTFSDLYIEKIDLSLLDTSGVTDMSQMFYYCTALIELNISGFDTSNVTKMDGMFNNVPSAEINVSEFDTNKVTSMSAMFHNCLYLTELDVSGFDTSNVTDMSFMFSNCEKLTKLDVSGFDTGNVTDVMAMFQGLTLTELDVRGFDTGSMTNMSGMFVGCSFLTELDVSGFDTGSVTNMESVFADCTLLKELDLSNFATSNVTSMRGLFSGCSDLETIYVSNLWDNSSLSDQYYSVVGITSKYFGGEGMFTGCTSLKGAIAYDPEKTDVTYANYINGYFTLAKGSDLDTITILKSDGKPAEEGVDYEWIENSHGAFLYDLFIKSNGLILTGTTDKVIRVEIEKSTDSITFQNLSIDGDIVIGDLSAVTDTLSPSFTINIKGQNQLNNIESHDYDELLIQGDGKLTLIPREGANFACVWVNDLIFKSGEYIFNNACIVGEDITFEKGVLFYGYKSTEIYDDKDGYLPSIIMANGNIVGDFTGSENIINYENRNLIINKVALESFNIFFNMSVPKPYKAFAINNKPAQTVCFGYTEPEPQIIDVTGIQLSKKQITLNIGKSETLTATISPSNATDKTVTWTSDKPDIVTVSNGKVTAKAEGIATISATTANGITATCSVTVEKTDSPTVDPIEAVFGDDSTARIYGNGRYDTALSAADNLLKAKAIDKHANIIVASGENFPDALSGGYLAKVKDAPILLVTESEEQRIVREIENKLQSGGTVYLLGGTSAVSEGFENKIKSNGITTERLAGAGRYETNIEILKAAGVTNEDLLICSGNGYADSLSASAAGKPILLVGETLTAEQKAYMKNLKPSAVYAIGGEKAVSNDVMNQITTMLGKTFQRVYGEDRYETSAAVAKTFCPNPKAVTLTYALNFPDGLSGSPLAMALNSPIILITPDNYGFAMNYKNVFGVEKTLFLGGTAVMPEWMEDVFK